MGFSEVCVDGRWMGERALGVSGFLSCSSTLDRINESCFPSNSQAKRLPM